jgi:hypothetical protein
LGRVTDRRLHDARATTDATRLDARSHDRVVRPRRRRGSTTSRDRRVRARRFVGFQRNGEFVADAAEDDVAAGDARFENYD